MQTHKRLYLEYNLNFKPQLLSQYDLSSAISLPIDYLIKPLLPPSRFFNFETWASYRTFEYAFHTPQITSPPDCCMAPSSQAEFNSSVSLRKAFTDHTS